MRGVSLREKVGSLFVRAPVERDRREHRKTPECLARHECGSRAIVIAKIAAS
jgi:hypothetical protein